MNCPNCNWPMVLFTGHWCCRKCGKKLPFEDLGYKYGTAEDKITSGINKLCPKCGQAMRSSAGQWFCVGCGVAIPWPKTEAEGNTQGLENK